MSQQEKSNLSEQMSETQKKASFLKFILVFCIIASIVVAGLYYLLDKFL